MTIFVNKKREIIMKEPLDFCRVKKIDEKGYGFLKSLHYEGDVFFHFSQVKEQVFLEKLQNLKRGDFFLYFTSFLQPNGKRKVKNIWYEIEDVPEEMLAGLEDILLKEFTDGKTNIYDLLYLFEKLRKRKNLSDEFVEKIMHCKRILNLPTVLLPVLTENEKLRFKELLNLKQYDDMEDKPFWLSEFTV